MAVPLKCNQRKNYFRYHQHKNALYLKKYEKDLPKVKKICFYVSVTKNRKKICALFIQDTLYFIEV